MLERFGASEGRKLLRKLKCLFHTSFFLKPRNKHIIFTSQVSQKCDPILVMVDIVSPSERNCQDTRQQTFQQKYTNKGFMQSGKKKKKDYRKIITCIIIMDDNMTDFTLYHKSGQYRLHLYDGLLISDVFSMNGALLKLYAG